MNRFIGGVVESGKEGEKVADSLPLAGGNKVAAGGERIPDSLPLVGVEYTRSQEDMLSTNDFTAERSGMSKEAIWCVRRFLSAEKPVIPEGENERRLLTAGVSQYLHGNRNDWDGAMMGRFLKKVHEETLNENKGVDVLTEAWNAFKVAAGDNAVKARIMKEGMTGFIPDASLDLFDPRVETDGDRLQAQYDAIDADNLSWLGSYLGMTVRRGEGKRMSSTMSVGLTAIDKNTLPEIQYHESGDGGYGGGQFAEADRIILKEMRRQYGNGADAEGFRCEVKVGKEKVRVKRGRRADGTLAHFIENGNGVELMTQTVDEFKRTVGDAKGTLRWADSIALIADDDDAARLVGVALKNANDGVVARIGKAAGLKHLNDRIDAGALADAGLELIRNARTEDERQRAFMSVARATAALQNARQISGFFPDGQGVGHWLATGPANALYRFGYSTVSGAGQLAGGVVDLGKAAVYKCTELWDEETARRKSMEMLVELQCEAVGAADIRTHGDIVTKAGEMYLSIWGLGRLLTVPARAVLSLSGKAGRAKLAKMGLERGRLVKQSEMASRARRKIAAHEAFAAEAAPKVTEAQMKLERALANWSGRADEAADVVSAGESVNGIAWAARRLESWKRHSAKVERLLAESAGAERAAALKLMAKDVIESLPGLLAFAAADFETNLEGGALKVGAKTVKTGEGFDGSDLDSVVMSSLAKSGVSAAFLTPITKAFQEAATGRTLNAAQREAWRDLLAAQSAAMERGERTALLEWCAAIDLYMGNVARAAGENAAMAGGLKFLDNAESAMLGLRDGGAESLLDGVGSDMGREALIGLAAFGLPAARNIGAAKRELYLRRVKESAPARIYAMLPGMVESMKGRRYADLTVEEQATVAVKAMNMLAERMAAGRMADRRQRAEAISRIHRNFASSADRVAFEEVYSVFRRGNGGGVWRKALSNMKYSGLTAQTVRDIMTLDGYRNVTVKDLADGRRELSFEVDVKEGETVKRSLVVKEGEILVKMEDGSFDVGFASSAIGYVKDLLDKGFEVTYPELKTAYDAVMADEAARAKVMQGYDAYGFLSAAQRVAEETGAFKGQFTKDVDIYDGLITMSGMGTVETLRHEVYHSIFALLRDVKGEDGNPVIGQKEIEALTRRYGQEDGIAAEESMVKEYTMYLEAKTPEEARRMLGEEKAGLFERIREGAAALLDMALGVKREVESGDVKVKVKGEGGKGAVKWTEGVLKDSVDELLASREADATRREYEEMKRTEVKETVARLKDEVQGTRDEGEGTRDEGEGIPMPEPPSAVEGFTELLTVGDITDAMAADMAVAEAVGKAYNGSDVQTLLADLGYVHDAEKGAWVCETSNPSRFHELSCDSAMRKVAEGKAGELTADERRHLGVVVDARREPVGIVWRNDGWVDGRNSVMFADAANGESLTSAGGMVLKFPAAVGKDMAARLAELARHDIMKGHEEATRTDRPVKAPEAPAADDGTRLMLTADSDAIEAAVGKGKWRELVEEAEFMRDIEGASRDEIHRRTGVSFDDDGRAWYSFNLFGGIERVARTIENFEKGSKAKRENGKETDARREAKKGIDAIPQSVRHAVNRIIQASGERKSEAVKVCKLTDLIQDFDKISILSSSSALKDKLSKADVYVYGRNDELGEIVGYQSGNAIYLNRSSIINNLTEAFHDTIPHETQHLIDGEGSSIVNAGLKLNSKLKGLSDKKWNKLKRYMQRCNDIVTAATKELKWFKDDNNITKGDGGIWYNANGVFASSDIVLHMMRDIYAYGKDAPYTTAMLEALKADLVKDKEAAKLLELLTDAYSAYKNDKGERRARSVAEWELNLETQGERSPLSSGEYKRVGYGEFARTGGTRFQLVGAEGIRAAEAAGYLPKGTTKSIRKAADRMFTEARGAIVKSGEHDKRSIIPNAKVEEEIRKRRDAGVVKVKVGGEGEGREIELAVHFTGVALSKNGAPSPRFEYAGGKAKVKMSDLRKVADPKSGKTLTAAEVMKDDPLLATFYPDIANAPVYFIANPKADLATTVRVFGYVDNGSKQNVEIPVRNLPIREDILNGSTTHKRSVGYGVETTGGGKTRPYFVVFGDAIDANDRKGSEAKISEDFGIAVAEAILRKERMTFDRLVDADDWRNFMVSGVRHTGYGMRGWRRTDRDADFVFGLFNDKRLSFIDEGMGDRKASAIEAAVGRLLDGLAKQYRDGFTPKEIHEVRIRVGDAIRSVLSDAYSSFASTMEAELYAARYGLGSGEMSKFAKELTEASESGLVERGRGQRGVVSSARVLKFYREKVGKAIVDALGTVGGKNTGSGKVEVEGSEMTLGEAFKAVFDAEIKRLIDSKVAQNIIEGSRSRARNAAQSEMVKGEKPQAGGVATGKVAKQSGAIEFSDSRGVKAIESIDLTDGRRRVKVEEVAYAPWDDAAWERNRKEAVAEAKAKVMEAMKGIGLLDVKKKARVMERVFDEVAKRRAAEEGGVDPSEYAIRLKETMLGGGARLHLAAYDGDVTELVTAKAAALYAYERAKKPNRSLDRFDETVTGKVMEYAKRLRLPDAEAEDYARGVLADAKAIAQGETFRGMKTQSRIIAKAHEETQRFMETKDLLGMFRSGERTGAAGESAYGRAKELVDASVRRMARAARGYRKDELKEAVGFDAVAAAESIGKEGSAFPTAAAFAERFAEGVLDRFRREGMERFAFTDAELAADPVTRGMLAETAAAWMEFAAKRYSYGKNRERLFKAAMGLRRDTGATFGHVKKVLAGAAEMIANMRDRADASRIIDDIEKLIDKRAMGAAAFHEGVRATERRIDPRLQKYWKYVKEAMRMSSDKAAQETARLQAELDLDGSGLEAMKGLTAAEIEAARRKDRDEKTMRLHALSLYGGLKEKGAAEIDAVFNSRIAPEISGAAHDWIRRMDERAEADEAVRDAFAAELTGKTALPGGMVVDGFRKSARTFAFWNVPNLFAKLGWYMKRDGAAYRYVDGMRRDASLAHMAKNRIIAEGDRRLVALVEGIYGRRYGDAIKELCVPDAKWDRFSRAGWDIPAKGARKQKVMINGKEVEVKLAESGVRPSVGRRHLSMMNLVQMYASLRQGDMEINRVAYGWDAAAMDELRKAIGSKGEALADGLVDLYVWMRDVVSPVAETVTGMPVQSPHDLYTPIEFAHETEAASVKGGGLPAFPSFLKPRVNHDYALVSEAHDVLTVYQGRLERAAHYAAWSEMADRVRTTVKDARVAEHFRNAMGRKAADEMFAQMDEMLTGRNGESDAGANALRSFVTCTTLGYNPASALKQFEGLSGWGYGLGVRGLAKAAFTDWTRFIGGTEHHRAMEELRDAGLFQTRRMEGVSEAMVALMNARRVGGTGMARKILEGYRNHSMDLIKLADGLMSGTFAASHYLSRQKIYLAQGMDEASAKRAALADTDYAIQVGQQSGRVEFFHDWQRKGSIGRIVTQFAGPSLVRLGVEIEAAHRAFMVDRDAKSFRNLLSKIATGHILCPTAFAAASAVASYYLNENDGSELFENFHLALAVSAALGPWSGMAVLGQIADSTAKGWIGADIGYKPTVGQIPAAGKIGSMVRAVEDMYDAAMGLATADDLGKEFNDHTLRETIRFLKGFIPGLRVVYIPENVQSQMEE